MPPPETLLYRIAARRMSLASEGLDNARVCSACGCFMVKKAQFEAARCPARDPRNPRETRWGEPYGNFRPPDSE